METMKCLICNEVLPDSNLKGGGMHSSSKTKKARNSDGSGGVHLISDAKSKFALTVNQYLILQKVLSLPAGACKSELINGPYCRECFTNINNVCHIMSALENLQESVQEFRKDFGIKLKASFEAAGSSGSSSRKRKVNSFDDDGWIGLRKTILDSLSKGSFLLTSSPVASKGSTKPKHLHEIISEMDPESNPDTNVDADLILRTTNGNMPTSKRSAIGSRAASARKNQPSTSRSVAAVVKNTKPAPASTASRKSKVVNFPCTHPGCDKEFAKEMGLNYHMELVHKVTGIDGEFVCRYCQYKFNTSDELEEHEKEHKGAKQCPVCNKRFTRVNTLNRHMLTHNKKQKKAMMCDFCSRTFYTKKSLQRHKDRDHKKGSLNVKFPPNSSTKKIFRPGRCKTCQRIVTDLAGHMKTEHPEMTDIKLNGNSNSNESSDSFNAATDIKVGIASLKKKPSHVNDIASTADDPVKQEATGDIKPEGSLDSREDNVDDIPSGKNNEHKTEESVNNDGESDSAIKPDGDNDEKSQIEEEKPTKSDTNEIRRSLILPSALALPPPQNQQSSKYQFKNLLKIGDK